jgi:AcrR family transcriptional regulator
MARLAQNPVRDAQRTRAAILLAAQEAFSVRGYADTGVRDITAAAGVNPALVSRYFGSKEGLFEAALDELLDTEILAAAPRENFGEAIVELLTRGRAGRRNPLPMIMLATAHPAARAIAEALLQRRVVEPLARWFGGAQAKARAARFMLLASGLTLYRDVYPLAPLTGRMDKSLRAWLVQAFQSLVE